MAPSQKLIQTWLIQAWTTGLEAGKAYRSGGDDPKPPEDWSDIIDQHDKFKPATLSHGTKLPFDESKCHARMFKNPGGFEVQCSRLYTNDGQCFCGIHQKQFINLPKGAEDIPFGRYNLERPQYTLNKAKDGESIQGDKLVWSDQKRKKKDSLMTTKKATAAKMRSDLKSWQVTHDGIKGKQLTRLYNEELAKREKAIEIDDQSLKLEIDTSAQTNNQKESPTLALDSPLQNDITDTRSESEPEPEPDQESETEPEPESDQESETEPEPESETEPEPEPESEEIEEYSVVTEHSRPDGSKYQVEVFTQDPDSYLTTHLESTDKVVQIEKVDEKEDTGEPSTVKEFKEFFKKNKDFIEDLGISIEGLRGRTNYETKYHEIVKAIDEHEKIVEADDSGDETEDMSDDDIEYVETTFEEIDYLEDENSDRVFNLQKQHVGDWDENGDILWKDKSFKISHDSQVQNL